jgi:hypothetical protein
MDKEEFTPVLRAAIQAWKNADRARLKRVWDKETKKFVYVPKEDNETN